LSKTLIVVLVLSVAWLSGVLYIGDQGISRSRETHGLLASDEFYQCRMAQRTDCYDEQDSADSEFEAAAGADWTRVIAWAAIPPAVVLPLTWFFFGRKRRASDSAAQDTGPQAE
jgi:hypothetical protein